MITKREVLVKYLEYVNDEDFDKDSLEQASMDENIFEYGLETYIVLDDEEATRYARDRILESLFAFKPEFIVNNSRMNLDVVDVDAVTEALGEMQEKLCERANPLIEALLEDKDKFVEAAIQADGRGHFIASYDGEENVAVEEGQNFYIYRDN